MIGRQVADRRQLFYLFNLEDRIPTDHLLRRITRRGLAAGAAGRHRSGAIRRASSR
jgi:hypothetical protein